eukprot:scaffold16194_cov92-Skeletonema_marinoi.AAC.3
MMQLSNCINLEFCSCTFLLCLSYLWAVSGGGRTSINASIGANYNGSLEALERHIHSMRYDMAVNRGAGVHPRLGLIRSPTSL